MSATSSAEVAIEIVSPAFSVKLVGWSSQSPIAVNPVPEPLVVVAHGLAGGEETEPWAVTLTWETTPAVPLTVCT